MSGPCGVSAQSGSRPLARRLKAPEPGTAGLVSGRDLSCEVAQENCGKGLLISLSGLDCGEKNGGRSAVPVRRRWLLDRKSTRLNSSHLVISYAVFCLKKKKRRCQQSPPRGDDPLLVASRSSLT